MANAMDRLRNLLGKQKTETPKIALAQPAFHQPKTELETKFDARIRAMGGMQAVSVSRAVLFRTKPAHQEA